MPYFSRLQRLFTRRIGLTPHGSSYIQAEEERRREEVALGEAVNSLVMNTLGTGAKDVLDDDAVDSYRQLFNLFDRNNDGSISVDELGHVFRIHLGKSLSQNDLNKIIDQVDTDNSQTIEFNEFLTLMASETWSDIEKGEIIKAFAVFDRNKDGYVDADELRHALCSYGEAMTKEEADELLAIVDLDKNGVIDYNEFKQMMSESPDSPESSGDCRQQ